VGAFSFLFVSLGKEMKLLSENDHSSVLHLSYLTESWTQWLERVTFFLIKCLTLTKIMTD